MRSAQALTDSHARDERFRLLIEGIRDYAIFMLDPDGWITTWSVGAERIKGYAADEVIGRHFSIFYPPEDRELDKPRIELKAAAVSGRMEEEGWRVRKDGSRFWSHVVLSPLRRQSGELMGFATITQDLTQRRQIEDTLRRGEARLAGIIASAMDAIISVNEEQRIVVFNAAAEVMFRCPAHEAVGQPLERFIPARFRRAHAGHIREFGETGVTSRSMWRPGTLWALRTDGEEFPIEASISQVDAGGQKFFTVILRDITERVGQERRLQEALAEAQRANQAKAEFLTMMSHELRTPLNAIAGYAQLLEMGLRGSVTAEQIEDLQRIQRNQHHLLALINNILNFARLEAGQLEYSVGEVRLAEEIAEVSTLLEPQLESKGITYEALTGDPDMAAWADVDKLRQVLLNLLSNAAKFTEPGGRVVVDCTADSERVLIHVQDSGRGIPADKLEKIFEPFVQLERSLTNTVHGTGLGLAISRDLARGMGGDLSARSTPGVGSTFTLTLPRATPRTAPPTPPATRGEQQPHDRARQQDEGRRSGRGDGADAALGQASRSAVRPRPAPM